MDRCSTVIVAVCLSIGIVNATTFLDCPARLELCSCSKFTEYGTRSLQIDCVKDNVTVMLVKQLAENGERFVRMDCSNETDKFGASLIPAMGVDHIYGLQIQHCRAAASKTALMLIFNRLGVARTTLARLEIMENELLDLPEDLLLDLPQLTHLDLRSNRLQQLDERKFRKLTNLTVLDLGDNQLTHIPANFFANFRNLCVLNLWNNSLSAPQTAASFSGLTNLKELDLSSNHMQSIDVDIFSGLRSLTTINLSGNRFATLPESLLCHNPRLEYFRLNNNRSPLRLPNKLFEHQVNLKGVELLSSQCSQLSAGIFAHNSGLRRLSLARNGISALPPNIFFSQTNLTDLDLSHNSLAQLDDGLLSKMTKVRVLKLSHNLLNSVSEASFLPLGEVTEVYLDNNKLVNIPPNTFQSSLHSLRVLNLSSNLLPNIISTFHPIRALTALNLANNNIGTVYQSDLLLFSSSAPVLTLQFRNSNIRHINFKGSNQTSSAQTMIHVDMQANPLDCDCGILGFLKFLLGGHSQSRLKLETDNMECATPAVLKNRKVRSLNLKELICFEDVHTVECPQLCHCGTKDDLVTVNCDNLELRRFPSVSSKKGQKIVFQISNDGITSLPEIRNFTGQGEITEIHAQNNQISRINMNTLVGLRGLTILDLSGNRLTDLPENVFLSTISLKTLKLTANQFRSVESYTFTWLDGLSELHMDHNQIKEIDDKALSLFRKSMRTLILHHNVLTKISADFRWFQQLETLDLSHNRIQVLQASDLQSISNANRVYINLDGPQLTRIDFKHLEWQILSNTINIPKISVDIQNNSIACGCESYDYLRYTRGQMKETVYQKLTVHDQHVTCSSPPSLAHRQIVNLTLDEIKCVVNPPSSPLALTVSKTTRDCECVRYKDICPPGCCCCYRIHHKSFEVNCSHSDYTAFPDLTMDQEFKTVVLYMEHNYIAELPGVDKENYELVTEIHAEHNRIASFNRSNLLPKLQFINLTHNQLQSIDQTTLDYMDSSNFKSIFLANNPWQCDCEQKALRSLLAEDPRFVDYETMQCSDNRIFSRAILCEDTLLGINMGYPIFALVVMLLALSMGCLFYLRYQEEIKVWMFAHHIFPGWVNEQTLDCNKKYDAFVSFSEEDVNIAEDLMRALEAGPEPYKLCLHYRDWAPGEWVMQQIVNSVEESRHTIILLSPHFLASVWAKTEFRIAYQKAMEERRARVIIILVSELDENTEIEPELKAYLKTNTYVKWRDTWFWEKLRYALNKPLGETAGSVFENEETYALNSFDKPAVLLR